MSVGQIVEEIIKQTVAETLAKKSLPDVEYIETDNLGEVIEKLAILHIRTWMLEDAIGEAQSDSEIADIKKKIDICFKVKRPKFVQAINAMVDKAILTNKSLTEDSVKLYRGVKDA
jgi:hypothetical protein